MTHMSSLSRSPTPVDLAITPRDRRFGRDDKQGRWWLNGDPIGSAFHTALSVTFPKGEAMFVESGEGVSRRRRREAGTRDPRLHPQEVIHSREHVVFNRKAAEAGYDLSELEGDVDEVMELIKARPPIVNLAATIALEHYTAMMAATMLRDDRMYRGAEPEWGALWKWHAVEEIEHKGVAYDTWLHATKDWSRWRRWKAKSLMMTLVTLRFWPRRVKGMKALLRQDGLTGWRITARIWWYLLGSPGVLRRSFVPWLSYFMPGFHPWNHDDRALIGKYESDYADAVMPAQASVPELAAAAA